MKLRLCFVIHSVKPPILTIPNAFHLRSNKGKTSGSRIMFVSEVLKTKILLHKPHPRKELLEYQIKQLIEQLEQEELL
jgi:hypothetical protein